MYSLFSAGRPLLITCLCGFVGKNVLVTARFMPPPPQAWLVGRLVAGLSQLHPPRRSVEQMPSVDLPGAWACNGTSTWYFLDAWEGTPVRCSREPGMIECATRVDGRECQWGRLFDKPAPYQPLRGVVTGATIMVTCADWPPNDGSDSCVQLGCYSSHAAHHCEPETPLPTIEARTVRRTTALILHR